MGRFTGLLESKLMPRCTKDWYNRRLMNEARGGVRFEQQSYYGSPMFWLGSFRQIGGVLGNLGQSTNFSFVALAPPANSDCSSPDLTLKL